MKKSKLLFILCIILVIAITTVSICYFAIILPNKKEEAERERLIREYYNNKLESYQNENERYNDYEIDVAFLGDSLTDGYDLARYYPQYKTSNRGIGGETTFGLEERMKVSVYDLKPKIVVMLIGANNINNMFDNYENLLIGLKDNLPDTKVILLSLTSMGDEWGKKNEIAAFNNVKIKALAQKYDYSYIDLFTPLLNLETNEIYDEYTTDGGHLTPLGYEVLTSQITPVLEEILGK